MPNPPCLPPRAWSLPAPTPTPVRSTRARTFCGHVPKRLAQRPTCWPPRIEHNRVLFVCHAASNGGCTAAPTLPDPASRSRTIRWQNTTLSGRGGSGHRAWLPCASRRPFKRPSAKNICARAHPAAPTAQPTCPPTCPREDLCFAHEPHTNTPPSFGCLNVVSFPVGAHLLSLVTYS